MTARPAHRPRRRNDRLMAADRLSIENGLTADYAVAPVDRLSAEMEMKWGIDRLPELVGIELAERFGRQAEKFNKAVAANPPDLDVLRVEAQRMVNAYRALDRAAEEAGAPKADPQAWQVEVDGRICAIVRDGADAIAYAAANPTQRVYSLEEIGRIIALDNMRLVNATKDAFPGATVQAVRPSQPSERSEELEDEIPW